MGGRKGKKGAPAAPHPESAAVPNGQEATDKTRAKPRSRRTKAPAPMANEDARNQDNRQPPRRQAANSPESQSAAHDVGQHMQADINVRQRQEQLSRHGIQGAADPDQRPRNAPNPMMSSFDMVPFEQGPPSNLGNGYQPYQQVQQEQAYALPPPPPLNNPFSSMMSGSRQQYHPQLMQSSSVGVNPSVQNRADTTPGSSGANMEHSPPQAAMRYSMTPRTTPTFQPSGLAQGHAEMESGQLGSQPASVGRGAPVQRPPNSFGQPGQARGYAVQQVPRPTQQQSMGTNVQLPPMDVERRHFPDCDRALSYFQRTIWHPLHRDHGVPQTHDDRLPYVKKIYDALVDVSRVIDLDYFAIDALKFTGNGVYGQSPQDIEAAAHRVVDVCVTLHTRGASNLTLRRPDLHTHDMDFTFAQRIYFMSMLLRHFKFCADMVMMSSMTMQYLAGIWSTLSDRHQFANWWGRISEDERDKQVYEEPYRGCTAQHPSAEESERHIQLNAYECDQRSWHDQERKQMRPRSHQQAQPMAQQQMQRVAEHQMRPVAHSQTPFSAQQQHALAMFRQQTRQGQGLAVPKRPATALDVPEAGPSTKRRVTNASPGQSVVEPQPNNPVMRGAVGHLLNFQFPSPPNDEGTGTGPTVGINFDEHFAPDNTGNGLENANGDLASGHVGSNNASEPALDAALLDYDALFGNGEMVGSDGTADEGGFADAILASLGANQNDRLEFDPEATQGNDDEGSEYTED